jgi:hypothetical protein
MHYLVDDAQQEQAQVDRLFGQQSCSMELASCRFMMSGVDADQAQAGGGLNALFKEDRRNRDTTVEILAKAGRDDESALDALFGTSGAKALTSHAVSPPEPSSAGAAADVFLGSKTISPLPCPSPEFEALSRPARRGMLLPHLTTRCSVSPLNASPQLEAHGNLPPTAFGKMPKVSHSGGFAPLSHGLPALHRPGTLPTPPAVPSTIELLAREEEMSAWGVGSGRLDIGPLEGGTKQLRVGESMGLELVWAGAPELSPPDSDASPGPLREGLDPLYSGSGSGGPLQQAIESSTLRQVRNKHQREYQEMGVVPVVCLSPRTKGALCQNVSHPLQALELDKSFCSGEGLMHLLKPVDVVKV